jgi:hypothetical protein
MSSTLTFVDQPNLFLESVEYFWGASSKAR